METSWVISLFTICWTWGGIFLYSFIYFFQRGWFSFGRYLFIYLFIYIYIYIYIFADFSQERPEGSLFNSYNTEVLGRVLLLSLDCSTLSLIHTLYCWVLSKEVSSTIFKVFGMTWPGIEPQSIGEHSTL